MLSGIQQSRGRRAVRSVTWRMAVTANMAKCVSRAPRSYPKRYTTNTYLANEIQRASSLTSSTCSPQFLPRLPRNLVLCLPPANGALPAPRRTAVSQWRAVCRAVAACPASHQRITPAVTRLRPVRCDWIAFASCARLRQPHCAHHTRRNIPIASAGCTGPTTSPKGLRRSPPMHCQARRYSLILDTEIELVAVPRHAHNEVIIATADHFRITARDKVCRESCTLAPWGDW